MKEKTEKPSMTYGMILREVNSSSRKVLEFYQTVKEERAENIWTNNQEFFLIEHKFINVRKSK